MSIFTLIKDGDDFEKKYWSLFIGDNFPKYEIFWLNYVVGLTNRPIDVHFKNDNELSAIGKSKKDLQIARLGYSAIIHLGRVFEILEILERPTENIFKQRDLLIEGFSRLIGAQDNVFELLERLQNPTYSAFNREDSETATKKWMRDNKYPLKFTRYYRNNLIHGGINIIIYDNLNPGSNKAWFPKIGSQEKYLDWRIIMDHSEQNHEKREEAKKDFIDPYTILKSSFDETIKYMEDNFPG